MNYKMAATTSVVEWLARVVPKRYVRLKFTSKTG